VPFETASFDFPKHPTKPGRVTIPGKPGKELAVGTLNSIKRQAGLK
jgi:predicted RNA binding protein YcfA (HicA-like mRNA interferase family)